MIMRMSAGCFEVKETDTKKNVMARKIYVQNRNARVYSNVLNVLKIYIKVAVTRSVESFLVSSLPTVNTFSMLLQISHC